MSTNEGVEIQQPGINVGQAQPNRRSAQPLTRQLIPHQTTAHPARIAPMAGSGASDEEVVLEIEHCIRIFKSGRVERYFGSDPVPPCTDAGTGVASKDHTISPEVAVRLYLPPVAATDGKKLPILVYFHGGGFVLHTAFNFVFHGYLTSLAARAGAIVVSVDYRIAPEHPLPAAYDDSWQALSWVASHAPGGGAGEEPWLTDHGDFSRLSLGGESAGANIAHHLAMRAGAEEGVLPHGARISGGILLVHPYFLGHGKVPSEDSDPVMAENVVKMWRAVRPGTSGVDDPWINPLAAGAPPMEALACGRVLMCLAETDVCRDRGRAYCDGLRASGWAGEVEVLEVAGQGHCFHLGNFGCDDAVRQDKVISRFLNL